MSLLAALQQQDLFFALLFRSLSPLDLLSAVYSTFYATQLNKSSMPLPFLALVYTNNAFYALAYFYTSS